MWFFDTKLTGDQRSLEGPSSLPSPIPAKSQAVLPSNTHKTWTFPIGLFRRHFVFLSPSQQSVAQLILSPAPPKKKKREKDPLGAGRRDPGHLLAPASATAPPRTGDPSGPAEGMVPKIRALTTESETQPKKLNRRKRNHSFALASWAKLARPPDFLVFGS